MIPKPSSSSLPPFPLDPIDLSLQTSLSHLIALFPAGAPPWEPSQQSRQAKYKPLPLPPLLRVSSKLYSKARTVASPFSSARLSKQFMVEHSALLSLLWTPSASHSSPNPFLSVNSWFLEHILTGNPSGHGYQDPRRISYQATHNHHILLRAEKK